MSDLIRREDALRVTLAYSSSYSAEQAETAIRALTAVQPDADKLVGHMTKLIAVGLDRIEALTDALDNLLQAITAEDQFHDRSLTITGSTANLRWLLEAEEDARAVLKVESHD